MTVTESMDDRISENESSGICGDHRGEDVIRKDPPHMWTVMHVPFRHLARVTVSLPFGAVVFSVLWALWMDMDTATATHCGVRNYLPSLSAAMGGFKLAQAVWRICIALHAAPRLLIALMYYSYLRSIINCKFVTWARVACLLNVLENLGLVGLSYISSKDNYSVHEKCFLVFILSSELYMILLCGLLYKTRSVPPTKLEIMSLRLKIRLVVANMISFLLAAYVFIRHNTYCEEGMYTIFAFLEYVVVFTNMGFHMTAFWDFYDKVLIVAPVSLQSHLKLP